MTTPLDPYATGTSALPSATQSIIPATGLGLNGATINTSDLNVSSGGGGVVLGYAGSPGVGNLYFSLSPTSGTDTYGNTVNTGLTASRGASPGFRLLVCRWIPHPLCRTLRSTRLTFSPRRSLVAPQRRWCRR